MEQKKKLQESGEMYLETIYVLNKTKGACRAIDVGEYMGYSKPSVSRAMGLLKNGGFLTVDKDGYIHLTKEGSDVATSTYARHLLLSHFFLQLGVPEDIATADACRIEHYVSEETFQALKKHVEQLNNKS